MADVYPHVRSLEAALETGVLERQHWIYTSMQSGTARYAYLSEMFPNAHGNTLNALLRRFHSAHVAAQQFSSTGNHPLLGAIPQDPSVGTRGAFRYELRSEIEAVVVGPGMPESEIRHGSTHFVYSANRMELDELVRIAKELGEETLERRINTLSTGITVDVRRSATELVALSRNTPANVRGLQN